MNKKHEYDINGQLDRSALERARPAGRLEQALILVAAAAIMTLLFWLGGGK
jgi:hypothetical protein